MSEALIIGDDLTGSNGTAVQFTGAGLRSVTLRSDTPAEAVRTYRQEYDTLVLVTDSRHLPAAEAAAVCADMVDLAWPARFVSSRCDSTLRGNVGPEAEAILASVRARGVRAVGLCMPAFPGANRQTVGGLQYMGGVRLEETELAREVRSPMTTSSVEDILRAGTQLTVTTIELPLVTGPFEDLVAAFRAALASGSDGTGPDVIVTDAFTDEHLARAARAAIAADPEVMWVGIDPGPGSLAIATAMGLSGSTGAPPLLAVSGSATDLTIAQLAALREHRTVHVVKPVYPQASWIPDVDRTARAVRRALEKAGSGDVVLLASVLEATDIVDLGETAANALPVRLGRITADVLGTHAVGGLYTTGGDITTAVLEAIGGHGIEVEEEVVPLAALGTVVGGPHSGIPVVTKGGLVGSEDTACVCLDRLSAAADLRSRTGL